MTEEWQRLVRAGVVEMIGPIRQELLSGVRSEAQFAKLKEALKPFVDLALDPDDYVEAAACSNRCRAKGIAMSSVDALLCAVSLRRRLALFTQDQDFTRYARMLPLRLHPIGRGGPRP